MIANSLIEVEASGDGPGLTLVQNATAVLYNGLGRYEQALGAAEQADAERAFSALVLPELIEAARRSGNDERAASALERLSKMTRASGTDRALGIEARSRALLSDSKAAEPLYREAIERLARTSSAMELARARLVYGEWLRREGRRVDAREQLRTAHTMFTEIRMEAFAERALRELLATGETVRRRSPDTLDELTAQEAQIARLAGDGHTNPEIGAQLFISPRTVEWHLRKVFPKLGVGSRKELRAAMPVPTSQLQGALT
jgi:DNA-binding CsgD family transcriptional regulator